MDIDDCHCYIFDWKLSCCIQIFKIELNQKNKEILKFWNDDFKKSFDKHLNYLNENLENQELYNAKFSELLQNMEIFESEEEITEKPMSSGDMIKKLFKLKSDKEVMGVANLMNMTDVKVLQKMQRDNPKGFARMAAKMGELPAMEEVEEVKEEKLSIEKTVSKLTEKNMLGRLAKQLQLNETGKEQLFNYFEKGELKQ